MAASEYHAGQEPGSVTVRKNLTERPVNRRLFMMGSVAIASALVAPAAAADDLAIQPKTRWAALKISDDHAAPFVRKGEHALYDCGDREPAHGGLFMTVTDRGRYFVVGAVCKAGNWYAGAPNRDSTGHKLIGPMSTEFFRSRIVGRVSAATFQL